MAASIWMPAASPINPDGSSVIRCGITSDRRARRRRDRARHRRACACVGWWHRRAFEHVGDVSSRVDRRFSGRHRLPAVYPARYFTTGGGLISYAPDNIEQYRRAAGYVDRILRREKASDLPVQAPTKFETVLNLSTAKAMGIVIPQSLLATANKVMSKPWQACSARTLNSHCDSGPASSPIRLKVVGGVFQNL